MPRFIIGYGHHSDLDVIEAPDKAAALAEATKRSMAQGLTDDDLADTTWAEPYDRFAARDYGLIADWDDQQGREYEAV